MDIKKTLKDHRITLQRFANEMKLSRPTLDAYIAMYEKNGRLPKEKYQIVFDRLFSPDVTEDKFAEQYSALSHLISRDKSIGVFDLDAKDTDTLAEVINNMKNDMNMKDSNPAIYYFINAVVNTYRINPSVEALAEYVAILNGFISEKDINQSRIGYYVNFFKCFKGLLNPDEIKYDRNDYNRFINRCRELKEEQDNKENKVTDSINEKLITIIRDYNAHGVDLDNIGEKEIIYKLFKTVENESSDV